MLILPILNRDAFKYSIALEGTFYVVRLRWQERPAAWYMSLGTADETWLAEGVKLVRSRPLFSRLQDSRRPPGQFYCFEVGNPNPGTAITRASLGRDQRLYYLTAADVAARRVSSAADAVTFVEVP